MECLPNTSPLGGGGVFPMIPGGYLFCFHVITYYPEGITEHKAEKPGANLYTKGKPMALGFTIHFIL
jgi:hypothetical protein